MGGVKSRHAMAEDNATAGSKQIEHDKFDAEDLLRHLQEQEGYEVYELFERGRRTRVPAPLRQWLEDKEEWRPVCAPADVPVPSSSSSSPVSASKPKDQLPACGDSGHAKSAPSEEDCQEDGDCVHVDKDHWVLLSTPVRPVPVPAQKGKGRGKGPASGKAPPPPPPAKGQGRAASKAKARPQPPPPKAGMAGGQTEGQSQGPPRRPPVTKAPPPPPFGKRLHWKLLPAASLGDTIFEELSPWGEVAPPLDTRQLERLFTPATSASTAKKSSGNSSSAAAASGTGNSSQGPSGSGKGGGAQGRVCLIDPQRAQNLAIGLRKVALPTEELCEVLRWMRLSHPVSTEVLEHVFENLLPPLLECTELFQSYDGPPEALRDIERQLLPLVKLPRLKARLQSLLFGKTMPAVHAGLLARIRGLRDACSQVRDSTSLRRILGTVLRIGNYLNHGVDAPDAGGVEVRGFTMESLLRLRDFRASQGGESSVSALHCVALHLLPSDPKLPAKLREELRAVLEVAGDADSGNATFATLGIADLREAVGRFRSQAELVHNEAERFGDSYRLESKTSDSLGSLGPLETLKRLAEDAAELANGLETEMGEALAMALRLLEYFGERRRSDCEGAASATKVVTAASSKDDEAVERFFVTLREFTSSLEACWREVLEQPRKLRLPPEATVGPGASRTRESTRSGSPSASSQSDQASAPSAASSDKDESGSSRSGGRGGPRESLQSLAKSALLSGGGLGILAGEAAVAAVRRRSRAAVPVRPAPIAALSAGADSGSGAGCGRGPRSSISAAAAEVD
eukprot:TRINITY_DN26291_c0_g1_i1.p1 TRINITY_DN26291_c0_g1~~TRINITY_DN26291_c0_g1_i1.p1  ORF type:complete len:799 (-),score=200.61 TRINITY_DN26291_c0_g1_i1:39-2435(-)